VVSYTVYDPASLEELRLTSKPARVTVEGADLREITSLTDSLTSDGWTWRALGKGGVLSIKKSAGKSVRIDK
jgi:hypothetical protein